MAPASNSTVTIIKSSPCPRIWRRTPSPTRSHGAAALRTNPCPAADVARSDKVQTAVDLDRLARDVRGRIRREEHHRVRDVVGMALAADRRPRRRRLARLRLRVEIVEGRVD